MKSVSLITGGLSFLLSACSGGGGSFDVDDVSNPSSSKPRYQDDTSNQRKKSDLAKLSIPSLGGGMKLVAQNLLGKREPSFLNENDYISYFSSPSTIKDDVEKENKKNTERTNPIGLEPNTALQGSNSQKYVYSGLYYIESWKDFSQSRATEKKAYTGYYGYAFYYGNKTATDLPVSGVAKYTGTWNFITATENRKSYPLFGSGSSAYNKRSAISEDIDNLENNPTNAGLTSEFTVNFGTKELTGELYYNERKTILNESKDRKHKLYDLKAKVYSNRFRGNVTPAQKDSTDHPFTSEGTLEGGFYGPEGQELGGKFLAHDKKVFGVFSAKEDPENQKLSKETLIDGKLTTFKRTDATTNTAANTTTSTAANTTTDTAANAKTDEKNFTTKDIPSFGEADYLLIDNQPIPLLPEKNTNDFISSKHHEVGKKRYKVEACCSNLSYVKFGMYYEDPLKETEKDKEKEKEDKEKQATNLSNTYYQFLLGHRTPKDEIPKEGSAKYHGNWFGYISDGETSYSASGDKERSKNAVAEFDVNFANKTLTGELKRHDNKNTVFKINAEFKNGSNDFTGTATATNFVIDGNNSHTGNTPINITTKVNGAFYGPKASELGGYFTYNGNPTAANSSAVPSPPNSKNARAAVVFGARQQVETTK
ncbi:transferrin-binding protein-like solute binding protein [Haemophilus influenzae]